MPIPKIDPYPPAPTPEDDEATFDEKAYEHAASLEVRRVQMNEVAAYVNTRASDANNRAVAADSSATASANSATRADEWANKAPGSVVASGKYSARHYSDLSDKFANAPEDVEVEPGKYSAQHYMKKAKKIADVHASTVETDPLPTVLATNVQEALLDLAYQADQLRVAKNQLKYGDGPYPVLDFQFAGAKYLDPRIEFSRASAGWGPEGKEYGVNEPILTEKGLWVSGAITNLIMSSRDINQWNQQGVSVAFIEKQGPTGLGFFEIKESDTQGVHRVYNNFLSESDALYTRSVYVKKGSGDRNISILTDGFSSHESPLNVVFDPASGDFISGYVSGRVSALDAGDGWWRLSLNGKTNSSQSLPFSIHIANGGTSSYSGDGESSILVATPQLELGAVTTPPIPTEGSQVTVANTLPRYENVHKNLRLYNLSFIASGSIEGRGNGIIGANSRRHVVLIRGSAGIERIVIYFENRASDMILGAVAFSSNGAILTYTHSSFFSLDGGGFKIGVRIQRNGFSVVFNGLTRFFNANFEDDVDYIDIGRDNMTRFLIGEISSLSFFDRHLTDQQLEALTL
ncbi:hypothetical protein ACBP93_06585 [Paenalcaligenes hominis]|uniref:phage head spike fiber domain-containing protein n=1 Tax=Paenalcaligenes hominis TaxID=643674 RepID=UPI0035251305